MEKKKRFRTDFLYAIPSYLIGAGSILNLAGNYFEYNRSKNGEEADFRAIESDWNVIGQDMQDALDEYEQSDCIVNG